MDSATAIEVFRTDLESAAEAERIASVLQRHFPAARIHIDMHDVDRVQRLFHVQPLSRLT